MCFNCLHSLLVFLSLHQMDPFKVNAWVENLKCFADTLTVLSCLKWNHTSKAFFFSQWSGPPRYFNSLALGSILNPKLEESNQCFQKRTMASDCCDYYRQDWEFGPTLEVGMQTLYFWSCGHQKDRSNTYDSPWWHQWQEDHKMRRLQVRCLALDILKYGDCSSKISSERICKKPVSSLGCRKLININAFSVFAT